MTIDPKRTTHHWDFVDEDGCLHCNCGIGVIEPMTEQHTMHDGEHRWKLAHDDLYDRLTHLQSERDALQGENAELRKNLVDIEAAARWGERTENQLEAEIARLTATLNAQREVVEGARAVLGHVRGADRWHEENSSTGVDIDRRKLRDALARLDATPAEAQPSREPAGEGGQ